MKTVYSFACSKALCNALNPDPCRLIRQRFFPISAFTLNSMANETRKTSRKEEKGNRNYLARKCEHEMGNIRKKTSKAH